MKLARVAAVLSAGLVCVGTALAVHPAAATTAPTLLRDKMAGRFLLTPPAPNTAHPQVIQPDTQIEPSIAVNPANPNNAVVGFQEGRVAGAGDETNGYATTFDGGSTWTYGEVPGLTYNVGGGPWDRASDAVVAFGPDNTVYYNSLVFDDSSMMGLCSSMAVNVSHDGGAHWSAPAFVQLGTNDCTGGTNDKNWIVVDLGQGSGHHYGRVYMVWDREAPVVYNYCDAGCDSASNWLPNFLTISLSQGLGAFPVILQDGSLGVAYTAITSPPIAFPNNEPDAQPGSTYIDWALAPAAGSTVWPTPLTFTQTAIPVASLQSVCCRYQRAGGLLAAQADQGSGTVYITWEDPRFRTDAGGPLVNDVVLIASSDPHGLTWGPVTRVNPGPTNDFVDRYNPALAVGADGTVHLMYRQRQEAAARTSFSLTIDTYYQQSLDGGKTFSTPLRVDEQRTSSLYGAFSRAGLFEGDYDQLATGGSLVYIARDEAYPLSAGETPGLVYSQANDDYEGNPAGCAGGTIVPSCLTHLHQRTWVAVVGVASVRASAGFPAAGAKPGAMSAWLPLAVVLGEAILLLALVAWRRRRPA
ncbi:MAG TPA: sialidase family protein [Candidatus Dormibacteraeota bacterium]